MTPDRELLKQMPVRAALALLIGIIVSFTVPASRVPVGHGVDVAIVLVFAVVLLMFSGQVIRRRRDILSAVYLELNKLRRLYHISKSLTGEAGDRYRAWFTDVHGNLHMYLAAFEGASLENYNRNNPGFRRLSYHIYSMPELESEKDRLLYADLLQTTGVVAETRQHIKDLLVSGMTRTDWTWLLASAFGALLSVIVLSDASGSGRLACGVMIGVVLSGLDFVRNTDLMEEEKKELASRYVRNISKLQYRRDEF